MGFPVGCSSLSLFKTRSRLLTQRALRIGLTIETICPPKVIGIPGPTATVTYLSTITESIQPEHATITKSSESEYSRYIVWPDGEKLEDGGIAAGARDKRGDSPASTCSLVCPDHALTCSLTCFDSPLHMNGEHRFSNQLRQRQPPLTRGLITGGPHTTSSVFTRQLLRTGGGIVIFHSTIWVRSVYPFHPYICLSSLLHTRTAPSFSHVFLTFPAHFPSSCWSKY